MVEDEEERPKKKKGKRFFTFKKVSLIVVFLLGLSLGMYLMHIYVEPALYQDIIKENYDLNLMNQQLDKSNDLFYNCLLNNEIDPGSC